LLLGGTENGYSQRAFLERIRLEAGPNTQLSLRRRGLRSTCIDKLHRETIENVGTADTGVLFSPLLNSDLKTGGETATSTGCAPPDAAVDLENLDLPDSQLFALPEAKATIADMRSFQANSILRSSVDNEDLLALLGVSPATLPSAGSTEGRFEPLPLSSAEGNAGFPSSVNDFLQPRGAAGAAAGNSPTKP
ncbi:unnamed protein product, partial [Amoebophrya sp. A25]